VVPDVAADDRVRGERWDAVGEPVFSVVSAPIALGGRFLGLIDLVNPMDGGAFLESDGYALSYMAEQFAEFLGQRGLLIDPELISAFKPPKL
jgi:GAF domain-containing protein